MSDTLGSMIEEVVSNLQGFSAATEQATELSVACNLTDHLIHVVDASVLGRGLVEIGMELIWVQSIDLATNSFQTLSAGRGWRGTTAVQHEYGETVTVSPAVPRSIVGREINNQILSMYPSVFGVDTTEFVFNSVTQQGWPVPADAVAILDVRWLDYQSNWQRIRNWEAENAMSITSFPTGKAVRIRDSVPVGRTIQVVYATVPTALVSQTDTFESTGLRLGAKDIVTIGTMARIVPMLDIARLNVNYVMADEMQQNRPQGSAINVAKFLEAKYQMRLQQERQALNILYPAKLHFTR